MRLNRNRQNGGIPPPYTPTSARRIAGVIGAPSSIGLRPDHKTGEPQHVNQAPSTLRSVGLLERLRASDTGDVVPPPYQDFNRPPGRPRNEMAVLGYSHSLGRAVDAGIGEHRFLVVLGGDCSIVLGCLVGAGHARSRVGLAYVDAHADFATPEESETGSAASMALALAVGHGDSALARLSGSSPLVQSSDVALVGRRDFEQPSYGHAALARSGILDLPGEALDPSAVPATANAVLDPRRTAGPGRFLDPCGLRRPQPGRHASNRRTRAGRTDGEELGDIPQSPGHASEGARISADAVRPLARHRRCQREASRRASRGGHTARSTALRVNRPSWHAMRRLHVIGAPTSAGPTRRAGTRPEALRLRPAGAQFGPLRSSRSGAVCRGAQSMRSHRDSPLRTAGDRCLWHVGGTAGEYDGAPRVMATAPSVVGG